jgi:membrane associated rhomboid family serine protease
MVLYLAMYFPENTNFHVWQIISHMFMHGGFMHIFFLCLPYILLVPVGEHWGGKIYIFYISCGLELLHCIRINYYYFNEGINTLVDNGFSKIEILQLLNEGKLIRSGKNY